MSKQRCRPNSNLLPYSIIQSATSGNAEAISTVLRHYERYIARLSMRPVLDSYGCTRLRVDEAVRRRVEIKLITGILEFRAS